jgi:intracellular multiplication protein IcmG
MADNDQNDEYKFDEYDSLEGDSGEQEFGPGPGEQQPEEEPKPPKNDFKRNALIAVGIILAIMLGYRLIGGMFSRGNNATKGTIPPAPITASTPAQQLPVAPQPQPIQPEIAPQQPATPPVAQDNPALIQKVDTIETSQQNLQTQVSSMNEQITNINNNVTNLTTQINRLSQAITDLTTQLNKQSEEINLLMVRTKPKRIRRVVRPFIFREELSIYYINAVIPGRAWLISTNGSTLTVREGTKIPGYGVVRLIDSMEGRILTSSGRVIKFSQEDS